MEWVSDGRRRRADFSVALPRRRTPAACGPRSTPTATGCGGCCATPTRGSREVRAGDHPDAGGLVVAIDKQHAADLAQRLEAIAGEPPLLVTSDEADASAAHRAASPPARSAGSSRC